jgi:capsular exopolysaccharide synthesis family protein
MSKNFELLRQTQLNGGAIPVGETPRLTPLRYANGRARRKGKGAVGQMDVDRIIEEESFRLVQSTFLGPSANSPRVITFAGVDSGNGCSLICVQAAESLANNVTGSVCLVDANLRTPSLPDFFGISNHHGLTDSLRTTGAIREFAKKLRPDNLWLLSCGSLATDSSTLLNSELMKTRIKELRKEFDYVLIDSPALNAYSDGIVLGQLSDGLILVLEANATRREAALKVAEGLRAAQIKIVGAVLNKRTFPIPSFWYHLL